MRQPWKPVSGRSLLLFVAAAFAITFAGTAGGTSAGPGNCSKAEARAAVKRLGVGHPELADPVYKVLCGAFAGPGSQTMVVSLLGPGSLGMIDWAVFRWAEDEWQLLMKRHQAAVLTAAGSDIRETVFVFRQGDPRCCPSGATRVRIWHWDGTRFTAGAWRQAKPGTSAKKIAFVFSPPPAAVTCFMTDDGTFRGSWVYCWNGADHRATPHVKMGLDGRLNLIATPTVPGGRGGPSLAYGKQATVGRFRCRSLRAGLRCTVIRSGKGVLFNGTSARRVGP